MGNKNGFYVGMLKGPQSEREKIKKSNPTVMFKNCPRCNGDNIYPKCHDCGVLFAYDTDDFKSDKFDISLKEMFAWMALGAAFALALYFGGTL